jgi:hypothetical protein
MILNLTAWQGLGLDGGRRSSGLALFGKPGKTAWVRLIDFSILNGAGKEESFSWGPMRAKDLILRLGYTGTAPTATEMTHGKAIAFGVSASSPTIVLQLTARHGVGGSNDWTVGYGFGCAIVQIPIGKTLEEARKDPVNILLEPTVLKKFVPGEGGPAFKFQVLPEGHWLLSLDGDLDGEADIDLRDSSPGAKPWTISGLSSNNGLIINLIGAGGAGPQTVNLTKANIGLRVCDFESVRPDRERWPLVLDRRETLPADPFPVHGQRFAEDLGVSILNGDLKTDVARLGKQRFGVIIPAAAPGEKPQQRVLIQTGQPETQMTIAPRLDLLDPKDECLWNLGFTPGQRILVAGKKSVALRDGEKKQVISTAERCGDGFLLTLPKPGRYELEVDGTVTRTLRVGLTDVPEIVAVESGKPRVVEVWCPGPQVETATVIEGTSTVEILDRSPPFVRILIQAKDSSPSRLVLNDLAGQEIGRAEIRCFSLGFGGGGGGVIAHHSGQETPQHFRIVMRPWTPGVVLRFRTINAICSFPEYALSMSVNSSGGPTSNGQDGFTVEETEKSKIGIFDYNIMLTSQDGGWAHN